MKVARAWWLRMALVCVAVVMAVALFGLARSALDMATYRDCDNLAGTCLRMRQQYGLKAIGWAGIALALGCVWVAATAIRRRTRWWHGVALGLAVALLAAAAATDPVHHLDNRYHGWLGDPSGR